MKQKYIATLGALALTLPGLAAAQTGTQQDRDARTQQQQTQQQERGMQRGTQDRKDRGTADTRRDTTPGATAGQRDQRHDQRTGVAGAHAGKIKLDNLTGEAILDQRGERIARVDDVLISQDGRIASVLVTVGGLMGVGGETKALDWDRLQVHMDADGSIREIRTTMSEQELENLPEFDERRAGVRR